ncbi:hypothetical protein [Brevundimonas pondensis]|uniref:Terminase small subunit n=1 Tax=Brevundimonas pondensis TaxID=2774189 RepID=A0ABX7SN41_9CAUL|nr:hypothetical protein [Brevundimonas pondensis]QTC88285.1 hypothetical protein IFE19_02440 [Brevundimonas pondensis]
MDDAAYWHEGEPRIVASGRWEQDEFGDTTYIPDHIRPSTAANSAMHANASDPDGAGRGHYCEEPEARDGYRVRSEAIWAAARRDYLDGDAAEAVCARYDLKLGTLRSRAAREGWRRSDTPDIWPDPQDEAPDAAPPDLTRMAAQALMRLNRAVQRGRAAEAASWLRTWRALTDPALLAALTPEPEPDPAATLNADLKAVAEVARDAARLSPDDHAGRIAIETRIAALKARLDPEGRISDDSDELDSVFPGEEAHPPPDPSPLEGEGGP